MTKNVKRYLEYRNLSQRHKSVFQYKEGSIIESMSLENPIRDEIFSPERLEKYARFLASELSVTSEKKKGVSLLPRVKENSQSLKGAYRKLTEWAKEGIDLSPAGEWIIDNFHTIEDQIREIKEDLPVKYYLELPKTKDGNLAGFPRVYAIALTLVAHLDSHIEIGTVKRFVHSYQSVSPLLIGELWAIPIALRIALIENLRRVADEIVICQEMKRKVDILTETLLDNEDSSMANVKMLTDELSQILGKSHICDCSTISQLSQIQHSRSLEVGSDKQYINEYLAEKNINIEEIVKNEHQLQIIAQVTVSNIITSMRLLSHSDWQEFFESLSLVESILAQDPLRSYKSMTFSSRDQYRNAIERIHKKTGFGEIKIAQEAIRMAQKASRERDKDKRKHHVGYYLVRKGVRGLEKKIQYSPSIKESLKRLILDYPTCFYLSFLVILTVSLLIPLVLYINLNNPNYFKWSILVVLVAFLPASDSGLNILNLFVTHFVGPFILPKINLENGIPTNARTFVIVPTIITSIDMVPHLLEDLEIRFLANQDENLYFALLSDFKDAEFEEISSDNKMIKTLKMGVENLNVKYRKEKDRFYLFHRKRLWNPSEKKYMGWERKRGKIHEFNRYLRGDKHTSFYVFPEHTTFFSEVKYVITLDTDTKLPRNAAQKLVGTILHPLNSPQFDKKAGVVTKGYSVLQPRISITPESSERSIFSKIYSGHTGIDPYTTAVSDTYQDLFGEGIYTGKGLYVVDAFESSLKKRVSENTLLSHDLFEGVFSRTALVSDIELLDDYPSHYEPFSKRNYRWVRGDWQIFQWIFSYVPNDKNQLVKSPLSLISRWKILDNLRRSLVTPATFIWLILGWTVLPGSALLWTFLTLTVLTLPLYVHTANNLLKYPRNLTLVEHLLGTCEDLKLSAYQLAISIVVLPYQTYLNIDAILRTLYRVFISKANLLEWVTAAQVESSIKNGLSFVSRTFRYTTVFSLVVFFLILFFKPASVYVSLIFIGTWFFSPFILDKISKDRTRETYDIPSVDVELLRNITCKTWNFFETFVTEEDNWLPPDNFQQVPKDLVAHRTSPTNIGLYLLSTCSAFRFGYIGPQELITRLRHTLNTMLKMPSHLGHFYNWYNTTDLSQLGPEYISTVDSGNLAGHLLAVKQICLDVKSTPLLYSSLLLGIEDIIKILKQDVEDFTRSVLISPQKDLDSIKFQINEMLKYVREMKVEQFEGNPYFLDGLESRVNFVNSQFIKISHYIGGNEFNSITNWVSKLKDKINRIKYEISSTSSEDQLISFHNDCEDVAQACHDFVINMDFSFLYNRKRKLFTIGFNVRDGKIDDSYYDLLASEARLTSFISIAKGDVPENHWFHLGRQMTSLFRQRVLISWSASMFEYLMPLLVMKDYLGTLLNETHVAVVKQQMAYAGIQNRPWGISESAFNARDLNSNYQYGPFGVPGLGLKRGLSNDFVVSPYSTVLASLVLPKESIANLRRLIANNLLTDFGFFEAVDYTEGRLAPKESYTIIESFMAHHQGMILVAIDNLLHENMVAIAFHNDPIVKSSELLLQERVPQRISILNPREEEVLHKTGGRARSLPTLHHIEHVHTEEPQIRILSNGSYTVMLTAAGSGFSKCDDLSVFRWEEDRTVDRDGQYFFIFDTIEGSLYPLTFQPMSRKPQDYKTIFSEHKVEFFCRKKNINTHTEVIVSAEDNVELRRITITNVTDKDLSLDLTSYSEPVLSTPESDLAHPAFNKLFIQTEYINEKSALLANRRKRSDDEDDLYGIHQIVYDHKKCKNIQYETDREKFLGRRNNLSKANGLKGGSTLSNTVGGVLDPILSFKTNVSLAPYGSTQVIFVSGLAKSRDEALRLIDQYHDRHTFMREDQMSWTQSQIRLKHLNIELDEVNTFQKLAGSLIYSDSKLRPPSSRVEKNIKSQKDLWNYGISGDIPILLIFIKNKHEISFITDILQFHEYLRAKNIPFDLVIFSEESSSYRLDIHEELLHQVNTSGGQGLLFKKGGIFLFRKDITTDEDFTFLKSVARVYFNTQEGSLKKQVNQLLKVTKCPALKVLGKRQSPSRKEHPVKRPELEFFNSFGGFKDGGKEYQIYLKGNQVTPAPWINVIANSRGFGFLVSETGSSHTWSENSRENRITPWNNDPVLDHSGEIIYLYDQESGETWSPAPGYARDMSPYLVRHGQGYTVFEHNYAEVAHKLTMYVSLEEDLKFVRLKLKNLSNTKRHISVYYYLEWVIGFHRSQTAHHIVTEKGFDQNVFHAQNHFQEDFGSKTTFACSSKNVSSFTCDRRSFFGRHGQYDRPLGINNDQLDGKMGAGLDPCLTMKVDCKLEAQQEEEIIFLLGQVPDCKLIKEIVELNIDVKKADQVLKEAKNFWEETLGSLQVKTPFPQFDILINHWMLYQTISSRIWARTAFYQSGGAYGFRDQLQDVTALAHSNPMIARDHILKAAAHQFEEGDVLHWWHPPIEKGVRTRFSDDLLWLPFVVDHYVLTTGDESILDEVIPFIKGPLLPEGQDDLYIKAEKSDGSGSLFEHCLRAIDRSLKLGAHQLPFMGSGDWNDGMSSVGNKGKGESVWLAWFLGANLRSFIEICEKRGDSKRANDYALHLEKLKDSVETTGWDGQWYRRAYFDDGTPLGSASNDECKIDSIAQSWSSISNLGNIEHRKLALDSAKKYLINKKDSIVHLFIPPFDKTDLNPGYIKGYVPGIRENGGQYTHAAIWLAMGLAQEGDEDTAFDIMNTLNPIQHSCTEENAQVYKIEPYVIPADIYSAPLHMGKGGWSWYTGSSSWYYRAFIESILGLRREGEHLFFKSSLPSTLPNFELRIRFGSSLYVIEVKQSLNPNAIYKDQEFLGNELTLKLVDDSKDHLVIVNLYIAEKGEEDL